MPEPTTFHDSFWAEAAEDFENVHCDLCQQMVGAFIGKNYRNQDVDDYAMIAYYRDHTTGLNYCEDCYDDAQA